ncbi:MAG: toll/interleukin-1 receptor domain-containing protein [Planctomycetes bacterium]|jgi:hypothetical protein|nr:toll/interleukin-1 receptor domain-containing protein [Planctomycetota bacterium]
MVVPNMSVFISYSSPDKAIARRLAVDLRQAGVEVWFDEFQLRAGDPILTSIREGIERSDVLLVLISASSIRSTWVESEVREAIERYGDASGPVIVPVRIDDTEPPSFLRSVAYVDLRLSYEEGLRRILRALEVDRPAKRVRNVIDASGLARELAKDSDVSRGVAVYVSTGLAILSIVVSVVVAWPAFVEAFGDRPRVVYSVAQSRLSIPKELNEAQIRAMLLREKIPDSTIKINILNRGSRQAEEIKVGLEVDGSLSSVLVDPDPSTKPVWVALTVPAVASGDRRATLLLGSLVPDRPVSIEYSYHSTSATMICDVVADGILAERVADVTMVPSWSLWQAIKVPVMILICGILLSIVVGVGVGMARSEKLRQLVVDLAKSLFPWLGSLAVLDDHQRHTRRNR